ncbi:hypothetical protein GCM10023177_34480 [Streptomyces violaceoruber]|nr:hypothetical protein JCM4020_41780 [Streptomyces coelicolor]
MGWGGTVITELNRQECTDCSRIYYERGRRHMVEAARTAEDSYPCDDFFRELETSKKKKDRERLATILMVLEDFAHRELAFPREINNLEDGIRELKPGDVRLPFFDVPESRAGAVRLTHGFIKGTPWAPRGEIRRAFWVREEDAKS